MRDGRKRVQRLKKMIITVFITLVILPSLFCIILAVRINNLEKEIEELRVQGYKSLEIIWNEQNEILSNHLETVENPEEEPEAETEKEAETEEEPEQEEEILEQEETLKKVYLTFDDGPSVYTEEILDILKRYNVKATFFVTGMKLPEYEEYFQKILEDGHSLGIHTYSHVYSDIYSSLEAFQNDFYKLRDYIYECTGEDIKIYRFPGGSANGIVSPEVRKEIMKWLKEENVLYFDWNVSSGDGSNGSLLPEEIAANCINGIQNCNTAMVLLHDSSGKKSTVEALPLIIEGINRMDDTILLPIDEETAAIQQIRLTEE